jgi:peptidoglycan/LPS O-acetylase OafA/YrhL
MLSKRIILKLTDISSIKRISFRHDINSLRALSVISVVLYHAEIELFKGGWLGVDIFFVISGYLISNIIISELNEGTFLFKKFYLKRAKRILPALFSTLILTFPLAYLLLTPKAMDEYVDSLFSSVFFYANFYLQNLDLYISEAGKFMPLLHTWSLAIEEQYYLLFPLLAYIVYKYFKKYFTVIFLFIFLVSIYLNSLTVSTIKFYQLQYRVWELLIGVIVMILSTNLKVPHLEKIGLPLMVLPIFYFDDNWIYDIEPKLITLAGVSLIIFSNSDKTILSKISSYKPIASVGLSSYSLYLLHQPIFAFYRVATQSSEMSLAAYGFYNPGIIETFFLFFNKFESPKLFLILFLILLSYLMYSLVEKKFNHQIYSTSYKYFIFFILGSLAVFSVFNKNSFIEYPNPELKQYAEEEVMSPDVCWDQAPNENCLVGSQDSIIYFIGDSMMGKIAEEFPNKIDSSNQYSYFYNINPYGVDFFNTYYFEYTNNCPECLKEFLSLEKEKKIIIFNARLPHYLSDDYFSNGNYVFTSKVSRVYPGIKFINDLRKLVEYSDLFILIYPIPEQGWNTRSVILDKKRMNSETNDNLMYEKKYWDSYSQEADALLDSLVSDKIKRIYPSEIFCESFILNNCVAEYNDKYFYLDSFHLSSEGAGLILEKINKILVNSK